MAKDMSIDPSTSETAAENEGSSAAPRRISQGRLYLLSAAGAVVTANAYYIHPVIAHVAADYNVSATMIGMVPAFNQMALALGILLLLPLGDWFSNRRLTSIFVTGQFLAITLMAFAQDYRLFVFGSTVLGFFTIAPYLLPAYVSKRVDQGRLGQVNAVLTVGIMMGILLARAGAGVVGEHFGWRTIYLVAAVLMLIFSILLPMIMDEREGGSTADESRSYGRLILSLIPIIRAHPEIIRSGTIQALSFGIFLSVWMGLGLHLTSPEMGYGVDVVGYLAIFSILNLFTTPFLGAFADRIGARRARVGFASIQLVGVSLLLFTGHSLWLLVVPIVVMNLSGPMIDITGRMIFLSEAPEIRTRLMTAYIVMMFAGGGIASWAGTATYDWGGWTANAALAFAMSLGVLGLTAWSYRDGRVSSSS